VADRLSQEAVEVGLAGQGDARLSQQAVEVGLAGQGDARLSQEAVEVGLVRGDVNAGVSQFAVEVGIQVLPSPAAAVRTPAINFQGLAVA
jgi:hypothetical protein